MIPSIIAQKGKKYNDFQGKRLGFVVNEFQNDTDPQSQPGVQGFENVDLSQEQYEETPGVFGFQPVTPVRDKASLFNANQDDETHNDAISNLRFAQQETAPEAPERSKKLDKFMRLAQFANIIAQGVNHFTGGFVSDQDITEGYWNKINQMDADYANQLREFNKRAFDTEMYNRNLYNDAILQQRGIAAEQAAAEQAYERGIEADELSFQRKKELAQMDIDARAKKLDKELSSKKAYNRIARANNQNDYLDAIQVSRENLMDDLESLKETNALGEFVGYKDDKKAQEKINDINALDREYNDARRQMGNMIGFDTTPNSYEVPRDGSINFRGQGVKRTPPAQQSQSNQQEAVQVLGMIQDDLNNGRKTVDQVYPQLVNIFMTENNLSRSEAERIVNSMLSEQGFR